MLHPITFFNTSTNSPPTGSTITQSVLYTLSTESYSGLDFTHLHSFSNNGVLRLTKTKSGSGYGRHEVWNTAASSSPIFDHDFTILSANVFPTIGIYNSEGQPPGFAVVPISNTSGRVYLQPFDAVNTNNYFVTSFTGLSGTGVWVMTEGPSKNNNEMWVLYNAGSSLLMAHYAGINLGAHTATETFIAIDGGDYIPVRVTKRGGVVGNRVYLIAQHPATNIYHLGWINSLGTFTSLRSWNATEVTLNSILGVDGALHVQKAVTAPLTPAGVIEKVDPTSGTLLASCNLVDGVGAAEIISMAMDKYRFLWVATASTIYCINDSYSLVASALITNTARLIPPEGHGVSGVCAIQKSNGVSFDQVSRFHLT